LKYIYFVPLVLLTSASISIAADIPQPLEPVPPPPVFSDAPLYWKGPYIGVLAGYGIAKGEFEFCCYNYTDNFPGGRIGVFAGYNWEFSQGVLAGIEADMAREFNGMTATASEVGTEWSKSIRLRVGKEQGNALVFVAAGWTQTDIYERDFNQERKASGWTVGAGVDWAVSQHMFIRTEYRYNNFDPVELAGIETDLSQSVVNIGLGFRF